MKYRQKGIDMMNKFLKRKFDQNRRDARSTKKTPYDEMTPAEKKRVEIKANKKKRKKSHNAIPARLRHKTEKTEKPDGTMVYAIAARGGGKTLARQALMDNVKEKG